MAREIRRRVRHSRQAFSARLQSDSIGRQINQTFPACGLYLVSGIMVRDFLRTCSLECNPTDGFRMLRGEPQCAGTIARRP
jgi:hypothetical protein